MSRPTHIDPHGNPCFPAGVDGAELIPDGYWDAVDLAAARERKLAQISAQFWAEVAKGCPSPKGLVDCDDQAQGRVDRVRKLRADAVAAGIPVDSVVKWTMLDKSQVPHDDEELTALGFAVGFGFLAKFQRKQDLEQLALDPAITDQSAIDRIDHLAGWP